MNIRKLIGSLFASACVLTAMPASAYSSYCTVAPSWVPLTQAWCNTGQVPANGGGHFVYYSVSPYTQYYLRDAGNGVNLRWGNSGWLGKRETVFGLYGWYWVWVKGVAGAWAYLNNT